MAIESKDSIKRRMIQNASRIWGYTDTQDISSFDPLVGMILGALADEINSISGEIHKSDSRIIQKLLDLLFSSNAFTHFPAHALAQASPVQSKALISDSHQFYFRKRLDDVMTRSGKPEERNIYFTPSGDFHLIKGQVRFLKAGSQMFRISGQVKEPVDMSGVSMVPDFSKLYIGLEIDRMVEDLAGLSLHFSLKNLPFENRFYHSLPSARWTINDMEAVFSQGLGSSLRENIKGLEDLFKQENDIVYQACRFVNDFYGRQFMVLEGGKIPAAGFSMTPSVPEEFIREFPEKILKIIPEDLLWIRADLPYPIQADILGELMVSMNCFPVLNRGINEFTQSLKTGANIIPLDSDDIFYDIKRITDSKGAVYELVNSVQNGKDNKNSYILRNGGIARFDTRDALEYIDNLTDLVRNESAAFSILGTDMVSSELKELDQIITRLKQRLEINSGNYKTSSYLLLNTESNYERVFVEFWSTSGELANNIRSGTRLSVQKGRDLDTNSILLLTNTTGGRQKLSEEDKLNKLRRSLLSKGRIVTREDIKALCFDHFGTDLFKVEIRNGVQAAEGHKMGLVQTLDIFLYLKKQHKLSEEDIYHKTEGLKVGLNQGSINLVVFRVFIQ